MADCVMIRMGFWKNSFRIDRDWIPKGNMFAVHIMLKHTVCCAQKKKNENVWSKNLIPEPSGKNKNDEGAVKPRYSEQTMTWPKAE